MSKPNRIMSFAVVKILVVVVIGALLGGLLSIVAGSAFDYVAVGNTSVVEVDFKSGAILASDSDDPGILEAVGRFESIAEVRGIPAPSGDINSLRGNIGSGDLVVVWTGSPSGMRFSTTDLSGWGFGGTRYEIEIEHQIHDSESTCLMIVHAAGDGLTDSSFWSCAQYTYADEQAQVSAHNKFELLNNANDALLGNVNIDKWFLHDGHSFTSWSPGTVNGNGIGKDCLVSEDSPVGSDSSMIVRTDHCLPIAVRSDMMDGKNGINVTLLQPVLNPPGRWIGIGGTFSSPPEPKLISWTEDISIDVRKCSSINNVGCAVGLR